MSEFIYEKYKDLVDYAFELSKKRNKPTSQQKTEEMQDADIESDEDRWGSTGFPELDEILREHGVF
jgi:hypothetical protein